MDSALVSRSHVSLNGNHFSVADSGGNGLSVMFQHGLCGSAAQTIEAFPQDSGARLITLECRGHGATPMGPQEQVSIASFADDVLDLHQHLRLSTVVVGGISMGAAIALRIAVKQPDLVKALILVRPAWGVSSNPANMQPNAVVGELLARMSSDEARAAFLKTDIARTLQADAPDNLVSLLGFFERQPLTETATLLRNISADGPGISAADMRRISVPTLVVGHAKDAIHPLALSRQVADNIPHARFVEITPKATDKTLYLQELHGAIQSFLKAIQS